MRVGSILTVPCCQKWFWARLYFCGSQFLHLLKSSSWVKWALRFLPFQTVYSILPHGSTPIHTGSGKFKPDVVPSFGTPRSQRCSRKSPKCSSPEPLQHCNLKLGLPETVVGRPLSWPHSCTFSAGWGALPGRKDLMFGQTLTAHSWSSHWDDQM